MGDVDEHEQQRCAAVHRFQCIYDAHYGPVAAYIHRRTTASADAQDALAETFSVAWRRIAEVPEGDAARPWLFGVARRVLANHRRGDRRRAGLSVRLRSQDTGTVDIEGPVVASDERRMVLAALGRLRDTDRELLRLAVWEELPHREIAVVVGCAEAAVAVRLHRARNRLAKEIGKGEGRSGQEPSKTPGRRRVEGPMS